ncbi:TetR/AcrR family transcriptional regulator [Asticcacaulis sp. DW145]|uniref:Helix-turn-helix domain containing protein n=1 Tax=Asticcacaulis currens TaxID=2984210 RepID=A0ABT5IAR2_9CAUL|nr:TetR/AcrR family transcriptional regulator [Asticcacaulis currens]MDC7693277.1 helix-turn-helix domain containing protein [Asticcacaulis currens]BEV09869.1 TetR/AcrR family transcriptional regulator [Asticcacaulis sp. DW145]
MTMYQAYELKDKLTQEETALPLGARARSKELNRLKILASAKALFRERGYEAATLRDIAREAGLSTGAVFANFADKNEIFVKVVEEETARVITTAIDAHDTTRPLADRLHHQLLAAYEAAEGNARLILSAFVMNWSGQTADPETNTGLAEIASLTDMTRQVILETLRHAQSEGELPAKADIAHGAEIIEDLAFSNLRRAHRDSEPFVSMGERLRFQIELIVSGLKAA